jgi:DNA polymerase-1
MKLFNPECGEFNVYIDADILAYRSCVSVEHDVVWDEDSGLHVVFSDEKQALAVLNDMIRDISHAVTNKFIKDACEINWIYCLSSPVGNFRKELEPTYKANRKTKLKPLCYGEVVDYLMRTFGAKSIPMLEGDDMLSLYTSLDQKYEGVNSVIVTIDKDLKQVPNTWIYDFVKDEWYWTGDEAEAERFHAYQTLKGDLTDGYSGCPKIGEVKAWKIVEGLSGKELWDTVIEQYKKAGKDYDYFLTQARLAKMLTNKEYDFKLSEVKLWNPPED